MNGKSKVKSAIVIGVTLFNDRKYMLISVFIAILSCLPFFVAFEKGRHTGRELVVIAVMCAISVVGRIIFAPIPGFKPVSAVVIITGMALGAEAGFITGSMTALASNVFFGQGPWTPFQMFSWGIIGFLSGLIFFGRKKKSIFGLIAAGGLWGEVFLLFIGELIMDVWTTVSISGEFIMGEYILNITAAIPVTIEYAVSNVIFLIVLSKPFNEKLERIKLKYGIFQSESSRQLVATVSESGDDKDNQCAGEIKKCDDKDNQCAVIGQNDETSNK